MTKWKKDQERVAFQCKPILVTFLRPIETTYHYCQLRIIFYNSPKTQHFKAKLQSSVKSEEFPENASTN